MLKLSTKGRYGTRLMLNLSRHKDEGIESVILKNISEEEAISVRYLEQIIIPLKLKKLVSSTRGAGGGYSLARHPSKIKLLEILESLEGDLSLVDCVEDEDFCERRPDCSTHLVWKKASELLKGFFESLTLEDLVSMSKERQKK